MELCSHQSSLILERFDHPKRNPVTSFAPAHWCSSPRQPLIHFLSLRSCQFWKIHINGTIHCVAFCDWHLPLSLMFSRHIPVLAWHSNLFLFMAKNILLDGWPTVFTYSSADSHLGLFPLLHYCESCCREHSCTSFCVDMFLILLDMSLGVQWMHCMVIPGCWWFSLSVLSGSLRPHRL